MTNGLQKLCRSAQHVRRLALSQQQQMIAGRASWFGGASRRGLQTQQFSAFAPPDPSKLPKPRSAKSIRRRRILFRLTLTSVAGIGIGYVADQRFNASSLTRSARTFGTGILIGVDYKINFRAHPPLADSIEALHARSARRVFELLRANGGLYLKIGQAIAMQSAILPPEFQKMFARMFDDAPQNDWADVERVVREDFGKSVEEVFGIGFEPEAGRGVMEKRARASASVAQVHWARLADGREVAIKIQKREIARQVGWDLWAFKVVSRVYSWWFDLPIYTLVPYISERLMLETDFVAEADNSEEMAGYVGSEPRLRGRVYIPKVYRELSSKRIMTAEWIEGIRLWDKEGIVTAWQGGWREGSPGAGGRPLDAFPLSTTANENGFFKPDRSEWKGPGRNGGLGVSLKSVMTTMVDLFSAQMFLWGVVHCDPHPGNLFVRRLPSGQPELVLIDHGLYIRMSPEFRHQYSEFWKALIAFDNDKIKGVVNSWGVDNPDIFASATLMRPYSGGSAGDLAQRLELKGKDEQERAYEMQMQMRKGIKHILGDGTKWPRELIFIGRNLRIVQGNNQFLGSPVNRIKITGLWASRSLAEDKHLAFGDRVVNLARHFLFRCVLFGSDIIWWWARLKQIAGIGGGMEDEIEQRMKQMAKGFGVELNHNLFDG